MLDILTIAGGSQALLMAGFFVVRRRRPGAIYFALLFFTLAFLIFQGRLFYTGAIIDYPHLGRLGFPISACIGPFFYLLFREQVRGLSFRPRDLVLFAPAAGIFLYLIPFFLQSEAAKIEYIRQDLIELQPDCRVISLLTLAYNFACYLGTLWFLRVARREHEDGRRFHLSLYIERTYSLQILVGCILLVMAGISLLNPNLINTSTPPVLLSLVVMVLALHWLYFDRDLPFLPVDSSGSAETKYEKSLLPRNEVDAKFQQLQTVFAEERPYLDPDFRMSHAADQLNLSTTALSQIVNRSAGKSFPEFVNEYRLSESQRRLCDPAYADHSILRIALDCGFNSKSSFNLIFKKNTGKTPSDWRRQSLKRPVESSARS